MASTLRASNLCLNCARQLRLYPKMVRNILRLDESSRLLNPIVLNRKATFSSSTGDMCASQQKESESSKVKENKERTLRTQEEYIEYSRTEEEKDESYTKSGAVDYSYFRNIIEATKAVNINITKGAVPIDPNAQNTKMLNEAENVTKDNDKEFTGANAHVTDGKLVSSNAENAQSLTVTDAQNIVTKPKRIPGLKNIRPKYPTQSYTLTPYINDCEALKNLLSLGVDLTKVEKDRKLCNFLLKCDWEKDIQPYMVFLHKLGIPDSALGVVISRFPSIFRKDPRHLEESIQYMHSKKFTEAEIAKIIERAPTMLNLTIKDLDANLGYLQKEFNLKGFEVRLVVIRHPKIAIFNKQIIQMTRQRMLSAYEFSEDQVKVILVSKPDVFMRNIYALEKTMQVLVDEMGMSRQTIVENSLLLNTRDHMLKQRHRFLAQIGRAQYDPEKENFVSMKELVSGDDFKFTNKVAKVPVKLYRDFLKTL